MRIRQFDRVGLKDGREGDVMEILGDQEQFILTIGKGPHDWEDIVIPRDEIERVIHTSEE